jgi:hypothetical protein
MPYEVFKRSAKNYEEFSSNPKIHVETVDTLKEARDICRDFNLNRTEDEIEDGTKLEYEEV